MHGFAVKPMSEGSFLLECNGSTWAFTDAGDMHAFIFDDMWAYNSQSHPRFLCSVPAVEAPRRGKPDEAPASNGLRRHSVVPQTKLNPNRLPG